MQRSSFASNICIHFVDFSPTFSFFVKYYFILAFWVSNSHLTETI